jgi:hypothetical protein
MDRQDHRTRGCRENDLDRRICCSGALKRFVAMSIPYMKRMAAVADQPAWLEEAQRY